MFNKCIEIVVMIFELCSFTNESFYSPLTQSRGVTTKTKTNYIIICVLHMKSISLILKLRNLRRDCKFNKYRLFFSCFFGRKCSMANMPKFKPQRFLATVYQAANISHFTALLAKYPGSI